jgi:hypothetical protein
MNFNTINFKKKDWARIQAHIDEIIKIKARAVSSNDIWLKINQNEQDIREIKSKLPGIEENKAYLEAMWSHPSFREMRSKK